MSHADTHTNSFHVGVGHDGTGCRSFNIYQESLKMSAELFMYASEVGYRFTLLDIGGGYPGDSNCGVMFRKLAEGINKGLEEFSSTVEPLNDLRIIGEPGVIIIIVVLNYMHACCYMIISIICFACQ